MGVVLVGISVAMKRYHDRGNSYKGKYLIGRLVHYHHARKHGCLQADIVLKEPRVLYPDLKAARRRLSSILGGA